MHAKFSSITREHSIVWSVPLEIITKLSGKRKRKRDRRRNNRVESSWKPMAAA